MACRLAIAAILAMAIGAAGATAEEQQLTLPLGQRTARRSLQATSQGLPIGPSDQVCYFDTRGQPQVWADIDAIGMLSQLAQWTGLCTINLAWFAAQVPHSSGARADVAQAKNSLACMSHAYNLPIAPITASIRNGSGIPAPAQAAIDACNSDDASYCYLSVSPDMRSLNCLSYGWGGTLQFAKPCREAPFTDFITCQSKSRRQCKGKCVWNPNTFTVPRLLSSTQSPGLGLLNTTIYQRGFCYPAAIGAAHWNSSDDLGNYYNKLYSQPPEVAYGTCSYGIGQAERAAYGNLCGNFNNPANPVNLGIMQGTYNVAARPAYSMAGMNATLANNCIAAGCGLGRVPGDVTVVGPKAGSDWFACGPDPVHMLELNYYNRAEDITLLRAFRACTGGSLQYDQKGCNGAILKPY